MPNTIDTLEIQIAAQTRSANGAFTRLVGSLEKLDKALKTLDATPLTNLSNGINTLTNAMNALNASGVKTADFTRLSKNIEKIASVNFVGLDKVADGLVKITTSFDSLSGAASHSSDVAEMAKAIGKLGGTYIARATQNIPALTVALRNMFEELSKAPAISNSVIQMTNALANLASNGSKVGSATRTIQRNLSNYGSSARSASKHTLSLASAFGKFYASYFLVVRGIKGLWKSVQSSMNYVETFNYFNVAMSKIGTDTAKRMGEIGEEAADRYSEKFIGELKELNKKMTGYAVGESGELIWADVDNLGLDPNQLMNFQARLGAVTNSVGLFGEASVQTSKALSMLSADLSSLTNTDLDEVMKNLSSGLIGQSRALYKYGIDITNATLAQIALEHGITKSVSAMSQSEKMQLRVLAILKQSTVAWGDQANTITSVANSYRVFKQQVANLGRILGNLVLPVIKNALPYVNGMVMALSRLFEAFGFKIHGSNWLTDLNDGISAGNFDLEEAGDLLDDMGNSLDADAKSANKLKKALQGFDELNVISLNDSNEKINIGDAIDLSAEIKASTEEYEKKWAEAFSGMENKAKNLAKKFEEYLKPVTSIFDKLFNGDFEGAGEDASNLVIAIFNFFTKAISKVDWDKLGNKIGEFLKGIKWAKIFESMFETAKTFFVSAFNTWSASLKTAPIETLTITFGAIAWKLGVFKLTEKVLSDALAKFLPQTLKGSIKLSLALTVASVAVTWAVNIWKEIFEASKLESTEEGKSILKQAFEQMVADINSGDFHVQLFGFELPSYNEIMSWAEEFDRGIGEWAEEFERKLTQDMLKWAGEFDTKILQKARKIDDDIQKFFREAWEKFTDWWNNNAFARFYRGIQDKFTKDKWNFNGVQKGLEQAFNNAIDGIKQIWNKFANWMNDKLSLSWDGLTIWGKEIVPPGKFDLGKIPTFANGGFVSADMFFANENGVPELVGTVGGRTAVASGTEITGISDAVYDTGATQASLLSSAVSLLQIIADKEFGASADDIFNSVRRSAQSYTNRTGSPAFPI